MLIDNKSKLDTSYLARIFQEVADEAKLSTVGLMVDVHSARHLLHGIAYKRPKRIILWLPADAKEDGIAFLFAHELRHIYTPKTLRKRRAKEADADEFARKVTGIQKKEIIWRSPRWVSLHRHYYTLGSAESSLSIFQTKYPQHEFRIGSVGKGIYRIQWKTGKGWVRT